jgi:hypothetical protein
LSQKVVVEPHGAFAPVGSPRRRYAAPVLRLGWVAVHVVQLVPQQF